MEAFAKLQENLPIRAPRTNTGVPHLPAVRFDLVHPRLASELRWVTATKILRNQWRNEGYVNKVLRGAIEIGQQRALVHLIEIAQFINAAGPDSEHLVRRTDLRSALPSMLKLLEEATDDPWESFSWHPGQLRVAMNESSHRVPVYWRTVTCEWLRLGLMVWAKTNLQGGTRSWGTVANWARAGSLLSAYIEDIGGAAPEDVDRSFILDFLSWVRDGTGARTDLVSVNTIARLLVDLHDEGIVPALPGTAFLRRGENKIDKRRAPKPFPDDLLHRIDDLIAHSDVFSGDIRLLLRIFRAVCPRPSEALALPLDCIERSERGYTLVYFQAKNDEWRRVPLPEALGKDLVEQATRVRGAYPGCRYLFPYFGQYPRFNSLLESGVSTENLGPWPYKRFSLAVWTAYQANDVVISTSTAEVLTGAQLHRFRHSVATGLLNEGWSQYEVQTFLGHTSSTMMQAYAEIHEDKLRAKYEEFVKHSVDITGDRQSSDLTSLGNVERLRDRMVRSTLPNGYCTLPENQTCDFVPTPCLSCKPFFRTTPTFLPIHIRQRDETLRELDLARNEGRERAAAALAQTAQALESIIDGLEGEIAS